MKDIKPVLIGALLGFLLHSGFGLSEAVARQTGGGGGSTCTGTGATWVPTPAPGHWEVNCAGTCTGSGNCRSRAGGVGTICNCTATGEGSLPNPCCNTGLDANGAPTTYGNCQSCPLSGLCTLACNDPQNPTECEAYCPAG